MVLGVEVMAAGLCSIAALSNVTKFYYKAQNHNVTSGLLIVLQPWHQVGSRDSAMEKKRQ